MQKRVQSALNRQSRKVVSVTAYADATAESRNPGGQNKQLASADKGGALQKERRTKSAVFRPLSNVGVSMSRLEH